MYSTHAVRMWAVTKQRVLTVKLAGRAVFCRFFLTLVTLNQDRHSVTAVTSFEAETVPKRKHLQMFECTSTPIEVFYTSPILTSRNQEEE